MATQASNTSSTQAVMDRFESREYSILNVPRVLEMDGTGMYVHSDGPYQDAIKSLEALNWEREKLLTPKLKGFGWGDYTFLISVINTKYFETREKLDGMYSEEYRKDCPVSNVERISFEDVLKIMTITISCNVEYYLSHRDEMEKDLGRRLKNFDANNKDMMKKLEMELFYNQVVKIFGEDNDGDDNVTKGEEHETVEKVLTLRDFRLLYADGNERIASTQRGNYYFLFLYITS